MYLRTVLEQGQCDEITLTVSSAKHVSTSVRVLITSIMVLFGPVTRQDRNMLQHTIVTGAETIHRLVN